MKKSFFPFLFLLTFLVIEVKAQDELFKGGVGDGYVQVSYFDSTNAMQKGGISDGYAIAVFETSVHRLCQGGMSDGYAKTLLETNVHRLSQGGLGDGFSSSIAFDPISSLSGGGQGDGYSFESYIRIYWTGDINTGWLNVGNWSLNRAPRSTDHVVIPGGKPNYPQLGAQHIVIGNFISSAGYVCKSLQIKNSGFLTGNQNSTIENKSLIQIRGTLRWKNLSENAWINRPGSKIFIDDGGILDIGSN